MISYRTSVVFMLLIIFLATLSFAGQNADATVELDLYTAAPTTTSNSGNNSLTGIGPNTDIYVKVYLKDVSNLFLYEVKLLIDSNKLTWVKYGTEAVKASMENEVNILNTNLVSPAASSTDNYTVGTTEDIYRVINMSGFVLGQSSTFAADSIAPDGEGLAGVIKLTTTSSFTTSDKAEIIVKQLKTEDNVTGSPEICMPYYDFAGFINQDITGKEALNTAVDNSVATNTSTIETEFIDNSSISIEFTAGTVNTGKTITMNSMGPQLPTAQAADTNKAAIESRAAAFYEITSDHDSTDTFAATIVVSFTSANVINAGLTNTTTDINKLVLAYFDEATNMWMRVATTIDPVNMTATASISHFSLWALVDINDPNVVPVELMSLSARTSAKNEVVVEWATATETNNYGFYIERSLDNVNFEEIGFVKGAGDSEYENAYSYTDKETDDVGVYYYRLKQVDFDGTYEFSSVISASIKAPNSYSLYQAYPNPFNPSATIKFDLKESGLVKLTVYNSLGQVVNTLINNELDAGQHDIMFNAARLASGIYFYKLEVNGFTAVKKMMLIK